MVKTKSVVIDKWMIAAMLLVQVTASAALPLDTVKYPRGYFQSPLDIPLTLAGNFGEPRRLHFHTGLDLKTNSEEGHKVFAAADGYVSRINVSAVGYGNALYITHPNGYTTVYGHLQQFNTALTARLRKQQYAEKSFAVDFEPAPGELTVKQGELIALSGNTGGSGGPHLHFEIRDSFENAVNPLLFGIGIKDNIKPAIGGLKFYALDQLKDKSAGYRAKLNYKNGCFELQGDSLAVNDRVIGFSVHTYDMAENAGSYLGVYNITVFDNGQLIYQYQADRFSFSEKRYVLSHIDYPVFINEANRVFHKCFVEPGNQFPGYTNLFNAGKIDLSDGQLHAVEIEVSDYAGNVSPIRFKIKYNPASLTFKKLTPKYATVLAFDRMSEFKTPEFKLVVPAGRLFDNVFLDYKTALPTATGIYSKIHVVGTSDIQAFDWFDIWVKAEGLPETLRNKAVLMYEDSRGETACRGGRYQEGFIVARARDFGEYYIKVDTTPPTILPLITGKGTRSLGKLMLKITDDLSGIADFDTYLDGKWVVTDYDAKNALLTHRVDAALPAGAHALKVVVTDERKNSREYLYKFTW